MDRFISDWREPLRWNAEFDLEDGPGYLVKPVKTGVDALGMDEDLDVAPITRTVVSMDPFEVTDEPGRYLPLNDASEPLEEVGAYLPFTGSVPELLIDLPALDFSPRNRHEDSKFDEFLLEARFADAHGPGRFGMDPRKVDLIDGSDLAADGPVSGADEDPADVFISLPDGEAAPTMPLGDGTEDFGFDGMGAVFGGWENPHWMPTLLPSPDGQNDDGFLGYPEPGVDPWG